MILGQLVQFGTRILRSSNQLAPTLREAPSRSAGPLADTASVKEIRKAYEGSKIEKKKLDYYCSLYHYLIPLQHYNISWSCLSLLKGTGNDQQ